MSNAYHRLFADPEDPHFTADIFRGKYQKHRERMWKHHGLESLILPLEQLSVNVSNAANEIIQTKWLRKGKREKLALWFIEQYSSAVDERLLQMKDIWEFGEREYATDHGVILLNSGLFGDEAAAHIRTQKAQGLVGKYAEFMLARVVNGMILDINGSLADIIVDTPDGRRIFIESKSARLTNTGKYISDNGNINQASRKGIFMKRNQIYSWIQEILANPQNLSYTALIDYDFVWGENMTFETYVAQYPDIFQNIGKISDLHEIESRLKKVIIIKGITLLPTWSLYDMWNRFVEKTRPVRWGTYDAKEIYSNSTSMFAQYLEQTQNKEVRAHLASLGIPHHTHTLHGLQWSALKFESFGFKFVPEKEMTYGKK